MCLFCVTGDLTYSLTGDKQAVHTDIYTYPSIFILLFILTWSLTVISKLAWTYFVAQAGLELVPIFTVLVS